MRWVLAALVLGLVACAADVSAPGDGEQTAAGGYIIEIRASDTEQTYLVTAPDGRTIGASAAEGASALMDATRAQALASDPPPQGAVREFIGEQGELSPSVQAQMLTELGLSE